MKTRQLLLALALVSFASVTAASTAPAIYKTHKAKATAAPPTPPTAAAKSAELRPSTLSAAEIVRRNEAARGGLQAWRAVDTLVLSGKLEAGGVKNATLPFVMEMKRPHKSRLEISFLGKNAVQVYDGAQGWKVRPFLNRDDVEPFTPAETKLASTWAELDGPLMDYARKGTTVEVQGIEPVEGQDAYKLLLTMKGGAQRHVWVDTGTFLERKIDGDPRKMDGRIHEVAVYYRDYGTSGGLMIPRTLETVVEGDGAPHKMHIEQVKVNVPLADSHFAKPQLQVAATVSAREVRLDR